LWTICEQWGWGTQDAGRALGYLKRFGSVTVLNGHIHQIIQKVEGNVTSIPRIRRHFRSRRRAPLPLLVPLSASGVERGGSRESQFVLDSLLEEAGSNPRSP
jgi:hypothetical protein